MFARKVHDLRYFGLCYLVRKNTTFADPVVVHMQHNSCGRFVIFAKKSFQHVHDEFHWRVIVIEDEHAVHVWPLGLRLGLGNNCRAGPTLFIPAFTIIIGHPGRAPARHAHADPMIRFVWGRHDWAEASNVP